MDCDPVTTAASEGSLPLCLDRFLVFSGSVSQAVIHLHREARSNRFVAIWPSLSTKWSHLNFRTRGCFFQPQSRHQLTAASTAPAGHAHAKTQPSPCLTADANAFRSQTVFIYLFIFLLHAHSFSSYLFLLTFIPPKNRTAQLGIFQLNGTAAFLLLNV